MAEPNPFLHQIPSPKRTMGSIFINILQILVIFLAFIVVSYLFLVIPSEVSGDSMLPTFHDGELLFTNKIIQLVGDKKIAENFDYNYKNGDVVVFQKPGLEPFIKRVIAIPGDSIMIEDGKVYINNKESDELYLPKDLETKTYSFLAEGETKIVPKGHYFLMGDNRNNSKDSRFSDIGFVSRQHIKGRVFLRWWPLEDFGTIERGEILPEPHPETTNLR